MPRLSLGVFGDFIEFNLDFPVSVVVWAQCLAVLVESDRQTTSTNGKKTASSKRTITAYTVKLKHFVIANPPLKLSPDTIWG